MLISRINSYFRHIADVAVHWSVNLHSISVDYDCIHITTADGVGLRVELGKPDNRIAHIDVLNAIDYIIQCASPTPPTESGVSE